MTGFEVFIVLVCAYFALDIVLGIALKRCVLPGLKCKECRK